MQQRLEKGEKDIQLNPNFNHFNFNKLQYRTWIQVNIIPEGIFTHFFSVYKQLFEILQVLCNTPSTSTCRFMTDFWKVELYVKSKHLTPADCNSKTMTPDGWLQVESNSVNTHTHKTTRTHTQKVATEKLSSETARTVFCGL